MGASDGAGGFFAPVVDPLTGFVEGVGEEGEDEAGLGVSVVDEVGDLLVVEPGEDVDRGVRGIEVL